MKFTPYTINILKNFYEINPGICFTVGNVIKTMSASKSIIASAVVDVKFLDQFCISDLARFLNTLSLFKDPELEIDGSFINISDENSSVKYILASEKTITRAPTRAINFPDDPICDFVLTQADMQDVFKVVSVLGLKEVEISGDGKFLVVKGIDLENRIQDSYKKEIGTTDKVYSAIFKLENLNKLLPDDYNVKIAQIPTADGDSVNVSYFDSKTNNIQYWIAVQKESKL